MMEAADEVSALGGGPSGGLSGGEVGTGVKVGSATAGGRVAVAVGDGSSCATAVMKR